MSIIAVRTCYIKSTASNTMRRVTCNYGVKYMKPVVSL